MVFSGQLGEDDINIQVGIAIGMAVKQLNTLEKEMVASGRRIARAFDQVGFPGVPGQGSGAGQINEAIRGRLENEARQLSALSRGVIETRQNSQLLTSAFQEMGDAVLRAQKPTESMRLTLEGMRQRGAAIINQATFKNVEEMVPLLDNMLPAIEKTGKAVKQAQIPFAGYALSIMFFGQQVQRAFTSIGRAALTTFQDISHSVEGNTTMLDILNAEWTYLKFVIGEALDPIIGFLIPIIMKMQEWVEEHPKLTAAIIAVGATLGALMAAGGGLKLAIDGFTQLGLLTGAFTASKIGAVSFSPALMGFLTNPLVLGTVAALTSLAAVSWKAFSETPEVWKAVKDSFATLGPAVGSLRTSLERMIQTILPNFKLNWDTIAWTIAWAINNGVESIKILIKSIEILAKFLTSVVEGFKSMYFWAKAASEASRGQLAKAAVSAEEGRKSWRAMTRAAEDYGAAVIELGKMAGDQMVGLFQGPMGFKQEQMMKQYQERYVAVEAQVYITNPDASLSAMRNMGYDNAEIVNMLSRQIVSEVQRAR